MVKDEDFEITIDDVEEALDEGDYELVIDMCQQLISKDPEDVDAMYYLAEALMAIDEIAAAAEVLEDALGIEPEHPDLLKGFGVALFEMGRWDDATQALEQARRLDREAAGPCFYLGLLAERRGDGPTADKMFKAAHRLDKDAYALPATWSLARVVQGVRSAVERVPDSVVAYLSDLPIEVEDLPSDEVLKSREPSLSPLLLCLFEGKGAETDLGPRPERVRIFRKNLEKVADTGENLDEELARALMYETIYFLELDDDEARDLGLEEALLGPPGTGPDIAWALDQLEEEAPGEAGGDEAGDPPAASGAPPADGSDATRGARGGSDRASGARKRRGS